jgi:hypothetical protein
MLIVFSSIHGKYVSPGTYSPPCKLTVSERGLFQDLTSSRKSAKHSINLFRMFQTIKSLNSGTFSARSKILKLRDEVEARGTRAAKELQARDQNRNVPA